ncbi:MAG TPA: chaperone modulator CbpM [Burkholderiales bacterium]|nr:chaperone modulator CbpM [Burkholderiales bacterium]
MSKPMEQGGELQFLDEGEVISFERMVVLSGLSVTELAELVEHGAFGHELHQVSVEQWQFQGRSARLARRARDLRQAFELDTGATSLVLGLLERIDELQRRMRELECRIIEDR